MADNKTVLEVKIEAADSAKTIRELRTSLKGLIEEQQNVTAGSAEWRKLTRAINDTEGKIGDLTDSFKTLSGSGVDRVQSSFNLFKEGLTGFDFGKIGTSLKGLGAAFSAIPIFLIVEGVMALIENFDELSKGNGLLAKSLRTVGDVIDWVVDKVYALTDAIGLTNSELDKQGEAIISNAEKSKAALDEQSKAFDRQIKVAAAAGKSTVELEKAKQQAIIDTNLQIVKQIEAYVRAGGELDKERKALLTASLNAIKDAKTEELAITAKTEKAKQDEYKKTVEERKKLEEDSLKESQRIADELFAQLTKNEDAINAQNKAARDRERAEAEKQAKALAEIDKYWTKWAADENAKIEAEVAERQKQADADFKASEAAKLEAQRVGLDAARGLSEAFFAYQLNAAKGDEKRQLEIKKRMFQVDKAFNVARAVQDGIRSVQAALTIPPPGGQILAVVNGALAAANVAKILATKFDAGGGTSSLDAGSTSVPNIPTNTPQLNTAAPTTNPNTTTFDEQGNNLNRVYVVESDITKSQSRVARLEEQATI